MHHQLRKGKMVLLRLWSSWVSLLTCFEPPSSISGRNLHKARSGSVLGQLPSYPVCQQAMLYFNINTVIHVLLHTMSVTNKWDFRTQVTNVTQDPE